MKKTTGDTPSATLTKRHKEVISQGFALPDGALLNAHELMEKRIMIK